MAVDEQDDSTRLMPPPQPKLPVASKPTAAPPDEHTSIVAAPPPARVLPLPPKASAIPSPPDPPGSADSGNAGGDSDHTYISPAAPPPAKLAPPALASKAESPVSPLGKPADSPVDVDAGEETVILPQRRQATMRLQRVQPPGRSEMIELDRASYLIGRSVACDLPLYSPTASREHARLNHEGGAWFIEPVEAREVYVNGIVIKQPTRLVHAMHVRLGSDELIFVDETAARAAATPSTPQVPNGSGLGRMVIIVVGIALLAVAGVWWLTRP